MKNPAEGAIWREFQRHSDTTMKMILPTTTNLTPSGLIKTVQRSRTMLASTSALLILTGLPLSAQTNPAPQTIPYTQDFGSSTFTTPPVGFAVWNGLSGDTTNTQALAEGSAPIGNATLAAQTATTTTGGAHGLAVAGNAKLYIQTSGNTTNGVNQPVLAINTVGKTNVTLGYDVESISAQAREVGIVSQFRVGNTVAWTTITPASGSNPYSQTAGTTGLKTTVAAVLPVSAEGQPEVQIRWAFWRAGTTGSSSGLAIDNVSVTTTGVGPDITPPTLVSQTPAVAATNVGLSPSISISFSELIAAGAGSVQLFQEAGASDVLVQIGTVTISGSTASFSPTSPLLASTTYYVLIANNAFTDFATPTANNFAGISSQTAWTFTTGTGVLPPAPIVINEVYGGGGNSGAPLTHDFVELYNTTNAPISLATYSVQYAGATGTSWTLNNLSGSIPANGYYLLQLGSGGAVGVALPNPNATGTSNMSATAGKVALTNTQTALSGSNPFPNAAIVDFVDYGTTTSAFETAAAPVPSNTLSLSRTNFADTGDNSLDFTTGAPSPQGSATSDTVSPSVLSLNPIDGSTTATSTQNLVINFSESVIKGTGDILIKLASDDSTVATIDISTGLVSVSGAVVTINPVADLVAGEAYYINIPNTAFKDAAENFYPGITNLTTWNFTVETPAPVGSLTAGDIAFVGYATGSDDHFSFVALKQIPANEIIRFSDNEWNGSVIGSGGTFNSGEGYITWTAPATPVAQGSVIRIDDIASTTVLPSASAGTITLATGVGGSFNMGSAGETVYAFQGGTTTPTHFLTALTTNGATDSVANTGLVPSSHVISLPLLITPDQFDHYQYNGPRTTLPSFVAYLPETVNVANWITNDELEDPAVVFNMMAFAINGNPSNNYSNWASTNNASGGVNGDHDNDGVRNGVEFFMGQTGSTFTPNPVPDVNRLLSYPANAAATGVTGIIQTSPDLATWTTLSSTTSGGFITATIPAPGAGGKIFARLNVVVSP